MSYNYTVSNEALSATQTIGASTTTAITSEFRISHAGSQNILVGVRCTGVTVGSGITLKLQSSIYGTGGNEDWIDGNTATVSGNGWFYIRMNVQNATDQAIMPLADVGRVVVTTLGGAALTVNEVSILQGL